jgi:5-methyltetrahydrofolate--homocysteine methyltransferase
MDDDILTRIAGSVEHGEDESTRDLVAEALGLDLAPGRILDAGLLAGMHVVGEQFRVRTIFLPDVLLAARAMYAGLELLRPLLARDDVPTAGRVVIGSVRGDLHDIGKNLVGIMLKGAGFDVVDLGHDVAPERFVEAAVASSAVVIGMSALLTTTMPAMKEVVDLVRARGLSGRIRTIVGGAPVTESFAAEIGADAYAYDATSAVERIRRLVVEPSA